MPKPSKVLTDAAVKKKRPRPSTYFVKDGRQPALELAVYPSGRKSWFFTWARGKRKAIGSTDAYSLAEAREKAKERMAHYRETGEPDPVEAADTLRDYLTGPYEKHCKANYSRGKQVSARLVRALSGPEKKPYRPALLDKALDELAPLDFDRWKQQRGKDGCKPATVNRELAQLRSALNLAVRDGRIASNPLNGVKQHKLDRVPRVRYLTADEEKRLRKALDKRKDILRPIVLLALDTGLRRGEIFDLQWRDLRLTDSPQVTVEGGKAKSGQTRHIPLNSRALAAMKEWRDKTGNPKPDRLVFPNRAGKRLDSIKRQWSALMKAAEITDFRFHDCRHHFASKLVMGGVPLNTVRELLGHADLQMTIRYSHLAADDLAAAVEGLA